MTNDEKLMQQALEALVLLTQSPTEAALDYADNAIDALRERLAQPEQRPVPPPWWPAVENILHEYGLQAIDFVDDFKKALAQPVACKPLCEICVKRGYNFCANVVKTTPIPTPTQRTWVGLTDEEIDTLVIGKDGLPNSHLEFARAIEAALRSKNNG